MPGQVQTLLYQIIWDDGDAKKAAAAWNKDFQVTLKAVDLLYKGMKKLSDGFTNIIKDSVSLEDALSGAKRTANLSEEQIVTLTSAVRDLSSEQLRGAVSAQNLGEILEVAGQRGELAGEQFEQTIGKALRFTEQIAKASQALDLSFQKTADALGKIQGPYGETSVEVGYLANAINVLADSTKAAAPNIISMSQRAAPALAALRVGQGDIIGLTAAIDALGMSSYTGATALQRAFKEMTANTNAFAEVFKLDAQAFNKAVQTDITGALVMLLEAIQKMATETPEGTQKVTQALKDLRLTGVGVSTALLGLAGLGPELKEKFLDPANKGLTNMDSINREFINSISRVSQLWKALGTIWTNTVGIISDALMPLFRELLQEVNEQAIAFRKWFKESSFIQEELPKAIGWIRDKFDELIGRVRIFVEKSGGMAGVWEKFSVKAKEVYEDILKPFFAFALETLPDIIKALAQIVKAVKAWGEAIKPLAPLLKPVWEISQAITEVMVKMTQLAAKLVEVLAKVGEIVMNKVAPAINFLSEKIGGAIEKVANLGKESYGESVFPEMVDWIGKTNVSLDAMQARLNRNIELLKHPGLFTTNAGAALTLTQENRSLANQIFQTQAQQTQTQAPQEVTLVMGDQEIGRLTAVVNDRNQQEQRRSFGANTNSMRPY